MNPRISTLPALIIIGAVSVACGLLIYWYAGLPILSQEKWAVRVHRGELPTYGEGSVATTFTVNVPAWTRPVDRIFLRVDDYTHDASGDGVPMVRTGRSTWAVTFLAPVDRTLTYRYNRNNAGYMTDERFEPDTLNAGRDLAVGSDPFSVQDEVTTWRWLPEEGTDYTPPEYDGAVVARDEPFIVGITFLDFFQDNFDLYLASSLDRIADQGFKWVGFAYSAGTILSAEPFEITMDSGNTYTPEQLAHAVTAAKERGLRVMVGAGIETDPENLEVIDAAMAGTHDDDWYRTLMQEWQEALVRTAGTIEELGVDIFTPSNQWPFWGDATDAQQQLVNAGVRDALVAIKDVYSGTLSMDYYPGDDPAYDYYEELDWIGDKWWAALSDTTEPVFDDMRAAAEREIDERYRPLAERYGKPIFLQQMAYASYDGASGAIQISTEGPEVSEYEPDDPDYPLDLTEQADAHEAVFQALADETIFAGVFSFSYTYWDMVDKSPGFRSKPAEDVWATWADRFNE